MQKKGTFLQRVKRKNNKERGYYILLKPRTDTQGEPAVVPPAPPTVLILFLRGIAYP